MVRMKNIALLTLGLLFTLTPASRAEIDPEGPLPLRTHDVGIGKRIRDFAFTDLEGKTGSLSVYSGKTVVVAINLVDCPIGRKSIANLEKIKAEFAPKGVEFLSLGIKKMDLAELKKEVTALGITYRYIPDMDKTLAANLFPKTSTDVFILDGARTLVYRGPVDDQYGIGYSLAAPRTEYLKEALSATLEKRQIDNPALSAPGCVVKTPLPPVVSEPVTFNHQISRLFQRQCQHCHRPGEAGPFSLITYSDVVEHAPMIEYVLNLGIMPPWFAAPSKTTWANDPTFLPEDKANLIAWLKNGMPEGDPKDAPLAMNYTNGWSIGTPDAVISLPNAIPIQASGVMPYQYFMVPTNFPEDVWVTASEIRNTSPQVVHHVLVLFDDETGNLDELGLDGYFAARVPGNSARIYPKGVAKKLPKGKTLVFQLHYTPNGVATTDLPSIGLKFTTKPPVKELVTKAAYNTQFMIPAGDPAHTVVAEQKVKKDFQILGFMPHMHLRGKSFKYELVEADGTVKTLLDVPRYDFNWQLSYAPLAGMTIPKGTTLRATAVFDNSSANLANPDPTKNVTWGDQTTEEMMIGYFDGYEL